MSGTDSDHRAKRWRMWGERTDDENGCAGYKILDIDLTLRTLRDEYDS